jgi:hypothetical protein
MARWLKKLSKSTIGYLKPLTCEIENCEMSSKAQVVLYFDELIRNVDPFMFFQVVIWYI